jgi:cation diffusion facilitator CzcD-associated flavoprotein CzcO
MPAWRTQRWPSLRLLTPNWQTRLPGHDYAGDHPDGFMPVADVVATITRYARLVGAPVRTATTVRTVRATPQGGAGRPPALLPQQPTPMRWRGCRAARPVAGLAR